MAVPVDVKRPCEQAERYLLDILSEIGGKICRCLPLLQIRDDVHNGVGEWLGCVRGGMVVMMM